MDLSFNPISFESTGRIHPESMKFLEEVAEYAEMHLKIKYNVIINYIITCISSILQKELASNIAKRSFMINSRRTKLPESNIENLYITI